MRRALLFHLGCHRRCCSRCSSCCRPITTPTSPASWCWPCYAIGYNLLFGYTGLLSLGHAMFFAAGLYGAGLTIHYFGLPAPAGFLLGVLAGTVLAVAVGLVALRTSGVSFMIVTMMFAQACYLATLYFSDYHPRRRGHRAEAGSAPGRLRRTAVRSQRSGDPLQPGAALVRGLPVRRARPGALASSAACWWPSARTRSAPGCWATTPTATSCWRCVVSGAMAARGGRRLCAAVRLCRLHLRRDPILDPAAALGAARRRRHRRSGRSSARC